MQADQFDALQGVEDIVTVEGFANGYTELSFNTGGNKEGYGGSTSALSDPAFRDALGYAIDKEALVEAVLAGHGEPGSTIIPPFHTRWHVDPDNPRTFDIEEAKLPPPKPHRSASARKIQYGVSGCCTAQPMPSAGIISDQVASVVHRRPPKIGTMKE